MPEKIAGPSGRSWGASTIHGHRVRGTGILNNDLYIGRVVWNKLRYQKDPATGKRVSRLNPEKDWIVKERPELRIVPDDLWQDVKDRQGDIRPCPRRRDREPEAPPQNPVFTPAQMRRVRGRGQPDRPATIRVSDRAQQRPRRLHQRGQDGGHRS